MIDAAYATQLARYGHWMNQKLFLVCAEIPDAERRRDRGAFFGSIHATLDHILYGDLAWLARFTGDGWQAPPIGTPLYQGFGELRAAREEADARLLGWTEGLDAAWLSSPLVFTSSSDGVTRELPTWVAVVHLFNHGTHHRGQLTTLLTQIGHDVGDTDLTKLPEFRAGS